MVSTYYDRGFQEFDALFDNITSTVPGTNEIADFSIPSFHLPLLPQQSKVFVDTTTGLSMPFLIPQGYIFEGKSFFGNFNTSYTMRAWLEVFPDTNIYSLILTLPVSSRGAPFNLLMDMSHFTTAAFDPNGDASHKLIFSITNDDTINELVGDASFLTFIRRVTT